MPQPRVIYSCVIDGNPKFYRQALNMVHSLKAVGVPGRDILLNLTPAARCYGGILAPLGVATAPTPFFADGKYCNKVAQLRNAPRDADFVVCCDTDILFLENIASYIGSLGDRIAGKLVDFANPPLEVLQDVAALFPDMAMPAMAETDVSGEPTLAGNLNGGLLVVPKALIGRFSAMWESEALRLHGDARVHAILGEFNWHIDQISFCFALARLGIEPHLLPLGFNFPLHVKVPEARQPAVQDIRVLHYHDAVDENVLPVASKTNGDPDLARCVNQASEALRDLFIAERENEIAARSHEARFAFVAGFHRSGTSAMAAGCEALGLSLGAGRMLQASSDNPKGYYESVELVRINETIARAVESDWDDIFFSFDGRQGEVFDRFAPRITRFLDTEILAAPGDIHVLKDPRIMQTYAIWAEAIAAMERPAPDILYVVRNPLECAESQARRHEKSFKGDGDPFHFFGADLRETLLLWFAYNARFLLSLRDERVIIVRYDDLMDAPDETLRRVARFFGRDADAAAIGAYASGFLEGDLRHHRRSLGQLREATLEFPFVHALYSQLCTLGDRPEVDRAARTRIAQAQVEPLGDLYRFNFLGRGFVVPKRQWIHERHMRARRR